jgi:hypothetical protein
VCFYGYNYIKSYLKQGRLLGYGYMDEKAGKEYYSTYEDGELLWNLE